MLQKITDIWPHLLRRFNSNQIVSDEDVCGYLFGVNADVIEAVVKSAIVGEDPFDREKIWRDLNHRQRLNMGTMSDKVLMAVDLALWDLARRATRQIPQGQIDRP